MLTIQAAGRLIKDPAIRTSRSGSEFTTTTLVVGKDAEAVFINLAAFDEALGAALAACKKGDEVAVAGPARVTLYEAQDGPRPSVQLTVTRLMALGEVTANPRPAPRVGDAQRPARPAQPAPGPEPDFDDDIPF